MKVTLRQLQVFDAVAATGSLASAASKLHMSQSAASSALTDLQVVLRRQLFAHVKGRPLQITDEGNRLRSVVRSLLSEIEDIERGGNAAPLSGRLVIGATPTIAETILPHLCVQFMQLHPAVQIDLEPVSVDDMLSKLSRFELQTAVIEIFPEVEGIELIKWRTEELVLVVAPDHPLAHQKNLSTKDLLGMAWCAREARCPTSARLRYMLHEQVGQLNIVFQSTSHSVLRQAVIAGGGIGCLSKTLVQTDLDNGALVRLDVSDFSFTRSLSLARPKHIWRNRLIASFDRFLLERGDPIETTPSALSKGGLL